MEELRLERDEPLHEKGYISDPRSKAKSVVFTEDGLTRAAHLLEEQFARHR